MLFLINVFVFIFGLSIGSFLNVLIDRLINDEKITGRSYCDHCHHKLAWYDLIPVLSFLLLAGRCRYCQKKISWQYPAVELLTGIIYLMLFQISNIKYQISNIYNFQIFLNFELLKLLILWGVFSCFIVIFVSDFKYQLISDWILWALFGLVFIYKTIDFLYKHSININEIFKQVNYDIYSALVVALPIFLIYFISKEKAMGLGDVYLSAIIGFLLGWQNGFLALYIAFLTGAIYGIVLIIFRLKKLKSKIAFGPFIIVGAVIMMFWGEKILSMIKSWYGV
ncbi:MAG: prepilin peptidase [Microgenomates group bacterium]